VVGAEGGFLNSEAYGLEAVEESVRLSDGAEGVNFCIGRERWIELEREGLDVFVVGEDSGCTAGTDGFGFSVWASGKAKIVFEIWFDDEAEIGLEAKVLESIIHEEDMIGELLSCELSGGNAIMSNDEREIGQKFAKHGGFIAPLIDIERAVRGEGCAVVFGGSVSRCAENNGVIATCESLC
jgi:hypothetical protein